MSILLKTSFCFLALLAPLCAQRQRMPAPAEKNPFDTPQDVEQGAGLFQTHCSYCHGSHGEGGRGADLTAGQYRYGGSDAELYATIRNGIPGSEMPPVRATDDEIWRIVAFVKKIGSSGLMEKAPGDPAAGKLVYDKSGCSACHSINKQGGNLGPDLTDIGRRRGLKYLEESLVKPEADVPINYRAIQVVLKSGQTVTGIRLNEDDISIQLRDTSDNLRSFLKENVKEIRHDNPSLMPPYGGILSKKDLEDLVAYLNSLRGGQ
ncbi:MAG TPA: c-type cytochrome [Bryobacterales bacterium]|jgi:putative heme-binding domain-containing protein|nr:c-type cytochrome [Bryobacterales bacterium]